VPSPDAVGGALGQIRCVRAGEYEAYMQLETKVPAHD
jgi:hypothetical protein